MNTSKSQSGKYPILDHIDVPDEVQQVWQRTLNLLAKVLDVPTALIMRVHSNEIEVFLASQTKGNVYEQGEKAPLNTGLYCETVINSQQMLLVPNATKDPHWNSNPDIKFGMISYCGIPLIWPNGEIFGTICVLDLKENRYNEQYIELLQEFRETIQFSLKSVYQTAETMALQEELMREKSELAMMENQNTRLGRIIESSLNEVYMFDSEDMRFIQVNRGARTNLGYSMEELARLTPLDLKPAFTREIFEELIQPLRNGSKDILTFETYHRRKNGTTYDVEVKLQLMKKEEPPLFVAIIQDITDRKKAEREIKESRETLKKKNLELDELNQNLENRVREETEKNRKQESLLLQQSKMAAMGEMIGAITHQWRQPLNAIGLIVQDLNEAYEYGELTQEHINETVTKAMGQIQFMSRTIDDFRSFFKPERESKQFSISVSIARVSSLLSSQMKHHNIEIKHISLEGECVVNGYPNEFEQALMNILHNARDAITKNWTKKASMAENLSTITIRCRLESTDVIVEIEDEGGGIPQKYLSRIFEPYFSTKEDDKGTGIGLYMAKMIIEEHMEGKLSVRNGKRGAIFTIRLKRDDSP